MYCSIQYIDINCAISKSFLSIASLKTFQPSQLHVRDTRKLLVNPNCPVQILLDYICNEIGIDKNADYDLCDIETGQMMNIKSLKPWLYATNHLQHKQTYMIVFYEKDEHGQYSRLEPLANRQSKQYSEILLRIRRQLGSSKRTCSSMRTNKRGSTSSRASTADSLNRGRSQRTILKTTKKSVE